MTVLSLKTRRKSATFHSFIIQTEERHSRHRIIFVYVKVLIGLIFILDDDQGVPADVLPHEQVHVGLPGVDQRVRRRQLQGGQPRGLHHHHLPVPLLSNVRRFGAWTGEISIDFLRHYHSIRIHVCMNGDFLELRIVTLFANFTILIVKFFAFNQLL